MTLRDRILQSSDLRRERIEVPEWNALLWITMLGLADRLEYERWVAAQPENSDEVVVRLLILTVTDETGALVFTEADVKQLLLKNPDVLLRLGRVAARVNRIGEQEVAAVKGES